MKSVCVCVCVSTQKTERYSSYPVYHSVYETFEIVDQFYDPSFKRLRAVAQVRGGLVFRLADSQLLPLDANEYAHSLRKYAQSIALLAQNNPEQMEMYEVSFGKFMIAVNDQTFWPSKVTHVQLDSASWTLDMNLFSFLLDSLFSAVQNFTTAARDFHAHLQTLNREE